MKTGISTLIAALLLSTVSSPLSTAFAQGSLTPPGTPAPTMKTLSQIEPRTPISSLPFTISSPGSYYVTTNLTGVSGTNGITISANNVTIDLGGFTLTGVTGALAGIYVSSAATYLNLTVQNGTLLDWPENGIDANNTQGSLFSQLNLTDNDEDGLDPGTVSQIRNCIATGNTLSGFGGFCSNAKFDGCTATANAADGFATFEGCSLVNCSANLNGLDGFTCFVHCTVMNSVAHDNGFDGIDMPYNGGGGVVAGCVCNNNGVHGITTADGYTLKDCVAGGNNGDGINVGNSAVINSCSLEFNSEQGINAADNCVISGCTSRTNNGTASVGIAAGNGCSIKGCVVAANTLNGIVVTNACLIENNLCTANGGGNPGDGGIRCLGSSNRVDGNHLVGNNANGLYLGGGGNTVMRNTAKGNITTQYSVGSGNDVGPIGSAATSTSPWANLQ